MEKYNIPQLNLLEYNSMQDSAWADAVKAYEKENRGRKFRDLPEKEQQMYFAKALSRYGLTMNSKGYIIRASKMNKGIAVRIKLFKVLQAVLPNVVKEGKPTYITAANKHVKKIEIATGMAKKSIPRKITKPTTAALKLIIIFFNNFLGYRWWTIFFIK